MERLGQSAGLAARVHAAGGLAPQATPPVEPWLFKGALTSLAPAWFLPDFCSNVAVKCILTAVIWNPPRVLLSSVNKHFAGQLLLARLKERKSTVYIFLAV